jgi:hypothetical protein
MLIHHLILDVSMPTPSSAIYDYIVKELAPTEHEPDEAPITIVCEPHSVPGGASTRGTISMRLKAGTTPEEARAIASTLQARVKGLCHLEVSGDETV